MSNPRRAGRFQRSRKIRFGLSRRQFLGGGLLATSALGLSACLGESSSSGSSTVATPAAPGSPTPVNPADNNPVNTPGLSFLHGVASGDPTADSVVLWTRITPTDVTRNYEVTCQVFSDKAESVRVASTTLLAGAARDFTVKVDQTGLAPGKVYYYRFSCNGARSLQGRTRTAPLESTALNFALVSCSSYAHGFFNAYRLIADTEQTKPQFDAVVHLGDYIYEYASDASTGDEVYGEARPYEPKGEIKTLSDYRTRHAYYKRTDPDLQRLHSLLPFITVWDDHESADNAHMTSASNHNDTDGDWAQRRSWAEQAYDEWMPIRLPESGNPKKIWRRLRYGNLADLVMLDTRLWARTPQAMTPILPSDNVADPARQLLGAEQKAWLKDRLKESTAKWKLLINQVVFHQWIIRPGTVAPAGLPAPFNALATITSPQSLNGDAWDAYTAERTEIINYLRAESINNLVILTGDVHSSWVADIHEDPNNPAAYNPVSGAGSVASEFVITSVTSPGLPIPDQVVQAIRVSSPHIKYVNMSGKGYGILKLSAGKAVCEYWYVDTIASRTGGHSLAATFEVADGANRITAASPLPAP